jgi:hypothetical protein
MEIKLNEGKKPATQKGYNDLKNDVRNNQKAKITSIEIKRTQKLHF